MMTQPRSDYPIGWAVASVGDLASLIRGVSYKKQDAAPEMNSGYAPLLRANNIDGHINCDELVYVREERISDTQWTQPGDVLIAMSSGSKKLVGKAAQIRQDRRETFGAFCGCLRPSVLIDPAYFGYFFQTKTYRDSVSASSKGSNINNLKRDHVLNIPLPVAPLNEQRRIVEKIETLFARIDKGEEALREAQKLLKRYRQSILKAAVTGELTRDWREVNNDKLEPASDLLTRILQIRRENWQGGAKYREPASPEIVGLHSLPEGWVWTSVDHLLRSGLSNGRSVKTAESGFPVLRLTALNDGRIDLRERKIGNWTKEDAKAYCVQQGDILVSRGNGSKQLVGRGGLIDEKPDPVAFPDTMIRIPLNLFCVDAEWFVHLWNSPFMRTQIESSAKTTAGIYKINQGDIRSFTAPLPSLAEQREIAVLIDGLMAGASQLEAVCQAELTRSNSLCRSILKSAFTGKLVSQDPNDEPASELLARIRAQS